MRNCHSICVPVEQRLGFCKNHPPKPNKLLAGPQVCSVHTNGVEGELDEGALWDLGEKKELVFFYWRRKLVYKITP